MKCPNCGNEIAEGSVFCEFCGKPVKLQRNGFVTFWLYLIMVLNILAALYSFHEARDVSYISEYRIACLVDVCLCFVCAYGADRLLKWKKWGFWMIVVAAVVEVVGEISVATAYAVPTEEYIGDVFLSGIDPIILYFILKIKKNGISCWSQLK